MAGPIKFKDEGKENPLDKWPLLAEESFDAFSKQMSQEASLSAILRDVKLTKGSFYHAFYDKMDLYLCTVERIGRDKSAFLKNRMAGLDPADGFWSQLKAIVTGAMEFSRTEPRYDGFWRNFLAENEEVKKAVKTAFPEISSDFLGGLVDSAIAAGQLSQRYDRDFINSTVNLYMGNMDAFIHPDLTEWELLAKVDQVIDFLRHSFT